MPANFFETYRTIAAQHGAEADFLERLSGFSQIIETREKLVRDHPLTVRVSGYDLNRLQAICQATGASKTEVVCRLIAAAALFVPECDEQSKVKPTYKKTVKVVTRTPTFATKQAREVTPPPPGGEREKRFQELFPDAVEYAGIVGYLSRPAALQRRFYIAYPLAAKIFDELHSRGYLDTQGYAKPREELEAIAQKMRSELKNSNQEPDRP